MRRRIITASAITVSFVSLISLFAVTERTHYENTLVLPSASTVSTAAEPCTILSSGPAAVYTSEAASDASSSGRTSPPTMSAVPRTDAKTTASKPVTAAKTTAPAETSPPTEPAGPVSPVAAPSGETRSVFVSYIEESGLFSGKTKAQAAAAIDAVMDNCQNFHLTDIYWHVRADSDAYYQSDLFPAAAAVSSLISAGFDPLTYAVEAAHDRGLRLYAWVNPYRVGTSSANARCGDTFACGGKTWYIPTSAAVQKLITDGVREIVGGYAVDGVIFDDYFYPDGCASENTPASFEKTSYNSYTASGGKLSPGNWRREAVNALVSAVYQTVHTKPGCRFVIAPGADAKKDYSSYYYDAKKWLAEPGYVDALCVQIYFGFQNQTSPFKSKVDTWCSYPRADGVSLGAALAVYKIGTSPDANAGTGSKEWIQNSDILARQADYLLSKNINIALYSYSYLFPDTPRTGTYQKNIAAKEIAGLMKEFE